MAGPMKEEEKRNSSRIKVHSPLRYQVRGRSDFNNSVIEDIGTGGIRFIIDRFIAPSNNISLQINVLSRVLSPIGRIMWVTPLPRSDKYNLGIKFVEFDPGEKKYLSNYIDMHTGKI